MRIGLCIYGSLDLVSGGFLYDRLVVRELRAAGHEVGVVALPWRRNGAAIADNLRPVDQSNVDVLIEDQLVHPSLFARPRSGVPVVSLVHNLSCRPGTPSLRAQIERRYFDRVDGIVAVCDATLAEVRAYTQAPAIVARAGRDHVAPSPRTARRGPLRILFAGVVAPHKGLHRLLAALAPLPRDSWTLDVVGRLGDPAYVTRLRAAAGDNVRWHDELRDEALWARFADADVFALPSDREAYSIACLEALGFGLPVLTTDRGGMREMIGPAEGFVLDPADLPSWTAAISSLADPDRLAAMSTAAHARYRQHGTWRDTAATITRFLRSLRSC